LRGALWDFNRLVENGISDEDFEATRAYLLNYSKLWVQSASRRLGYAMDGAFYDKDDLVTELGRRLPKLTADQVNAAVRKHLKTSGFRVAMVAGDAKALAEQLQSGKPTPLTYDTEGTPEEILAEDKQIEAYPLKALRVKIVPASEMFQK
jgi:zinc protease